MDSVKRRLKDKAFAKGVSRDDVRKGAEELGVSLEEHIAFCIAALCEHADALGLRGTIPVEARPPERVKEASRFNAELPPLPVCQNYGRLDLAFGNGPIPFE